MNRTAWLALYAGSSLLASEAMAQSLEEVIVTGRAQEYYLQTSTSVGSKIDLDIADLPQSVQVLTEQLIIDQAARDITDLYRSIAGVSEFSYSGVTFRGFRDSSNVFYDGVRGDPYSGFSVPQLFNVERVEVLKGPSAALYGGGEPGGMINYVTKKPSFDEQGELVLTAGNYDLGGVSAESRGGLTDSIAYRVGAFYEQQNHFRDNADSVNLELAGGLTFALSEATELTTTVNFVKQDLAGNRFRGVHADDEGNFIVDRSYNTNEAFDFQDLEALILQAELSHEFSDTLRLNATLRYLDNERVQAYHEPRGWVDVNGDGERNALDGVIMREYRDQFRANKEYSLTVDVVKKFETGNWQHQLLFGSDFHDVDADYTAFIARGEGMGVINLNVFNPNYGETNPATYDLRDLNRDGSTRQRYSVYLQDYIEFTEHWSVMLGARYDHFEDEDKRFDFAFSDSNLAPRAGLIYKPADNSTIYLNYSQSFNPSSVLRQRDVAADNVTLQPETGTQWELGWKQYWLDGRLMSTAAVYQIVKEDVAVSNPLDQGEDDDQPEFVNLGEVESEGLELTLVGDLSEHWTLTANYAWNETSVVEGSGLRNSIDSGDNFANAPKHQLGLWTRYELAAIDSSIAFGVDYVSEQFSLSNLPVKSYTVFDASWTTSWDAITLQINVSNLFDKEYAVSGFLQRTGHFPGAPREIVAQLRYDF